MPFNVYITGDGWKDVTKRNLQRSGSHTFTTRKLLVLTTLQKYLY